MAMMKKALQLKRRDVKPSSVQRTALTSGQQRKHELPLTPFMNQHAFVTAVAKEYGADVADYCQSHTMAGDIDYRSRQRVLSRALVEVQPARSEKNPAYCDNGVRFVKKMPA